MQKRSFGSLTIWSLDGPKIIQTLRGKASRLLETDPRVGSVLLFGSLVKGNYAPGSDADVCIMLSQEDPRRRSDRVYEFLDAFRGVGIDVDLVVYTPSELARMQEERGAFIAEVLDNGIVLASRASIETAGRA